MDALSLGINHLQNNQQNNRQKSSKSNKIVHKNTISYNKFKTPCINGNLDKELLRTGDRFIPFKNDENFQNFLLNTPNLNISYEIEKTKIIESEKLSPLEEKPETNYASFIVDNMLRTNTDIYNFPQSKFAKFRKNSIYTFSKKISFNSSNIHNSSNSNTQQKDSNIFMENAKINKTSNKKSINSNNINTSNELLRTKNKNTKNILNIVFYFNL
jgi:hypothetical protein